MARFRYTCPKGHSMALDGTWTTLQVDISDVEDAGNSRSNGYNYCMDRFGEWAVQQWPLTCEGVK